MESLRTNSCTTRARLWRVFRPQTLAPLLAFALALLAAACGRGGPEMAAPPALPSVGLEHYAGDEFSLSYPATAWLQVEEATRSLRIVGPELAIRPADAEWTMAGPGWVLDVVAWDNPDGLALGRWVETHGIDREALSPPQLDSATVAGEPAVLVTTFGGDSWIRTYYLARGGRVVALRYADVPLANSPIAPIQQEVYALILGTFRWEDGVAR